MVGVVVVVGSVGTSLRCAVVDVDVDWAVGGYVNAGGVHWANGRVYVYDGNVNAPRAQVRGHACPVNWSGRVRGRDGSCECVRCHCYDGHVSRPRVGARYGLRCAVLPHSHRARNRSWVTVQV